MQRKTKVLYLVNPDVERVIHGTDSGLTTDRTFYTHFTSSMERETDYLCLGYIPELRDRRFKHMRGLHPKDLKYNWKECNWEWQFTKEDNIGKNIEKKSNSHEIGDFKIAEAIVTRMKESAELNSNGVVYVNS